jgi:hypothetical protein
MESAPTLAGATVSPIFSLNGFVLVVPPTPLIYSCGPLTSAGDPTDNTIQVTCPLYYEREWYRRFQGEIGHTVEETIAIVAAKGATMINEPTITDIGFYRHIVTIRYSTAPWSNT